MRKSNNKFEINGDRVYITHPDWKFVAVASIRDDYKEELMSVTWSKSGRYLYNKKLGGYLHIYIMKKWYGEEKYEKLKEEGYVVDHMDNNGYNCCINNLAFLISDENKMKGMSVDKMGSDKTHIALSLFMDFETQLKQITIMFNYPAKAIISNLDKAAVIELVYLLYDAEYEVVLNDARQILYDYRRDFSFEPEKLHDVDFHIEGEYGIAAPVECYDEYLKGGHGHTVGFIDSCAPIRNWRVEDKRQFFYLRGKQNNNMQQENE